MGCTHEHEHVAVSGSGRMHAPYGFLNSHQVGEVGYAVPVHGSGDQADVQRVEEPFARGAISGRPLESHVDRRDDLTHHRPAT